MEIFLLSIYFASMLFSFIGLTRLIVEQYKRGTTLGNLILHSIMTVIIAVIPIANTLVLISMIEESEVFNGVMGKKIGGKRKV